jgi:hypothetical protein
MLLDLVPGQASLIGTGPTNSFKSFTRNISTAIAVGKYFFVQIVHFVKYLRNTLLPCSLATLLFANLANRG